MLTLLLGFQLTGVFVIMLYKMFVTDVFRFASIYLIVLMGQSIAFYAIEDPTQAAQYLYPGQELGSDMTWFKEFWWRLESTFLILLGQISFDYVESVSLPEYGWLTDLLLLFHVVFCPIILLNMLIAMVGDTFGDVKDNAQQEWTLAYAQIIISIESEMNSKQKREIKEYWTNIQGKRYLQIQDENKDFYKTVSNDDQAELVEILQRLDLNKDGIIDTTELKIGEQVLKKLGKIVEEPDDGFRAQKDHVAVLESSENFGGTDHLSGRLNPELTSA